MNLLVATPDGNQTLSPPTLPSRRHSPGARKRIILPLTEQVVGLFETIVGSIVKPNVGCLDEAKK